MFYENEPCPGCERPMTAKEDIVTCPVCGTPQHRECWLTQGMCVNTERHDAGYVWEPAQKEEPEPEEEAPPPAERIACPVCGGENPPEARGCIHCGNTIYADRFGNDDKADNDDGEIGGATVSDIAAYVQLRAPRYISKFKRMAAANRKLSWSWAAFFFSFYWFFYRKLYTLGLLFMGISLVISLFAAPAYGDYLEQGQSFLEQSAQEDASPEELQAAYEAWAASIVAAIPFGALQLLTWCCAGFIANGQYKKKVFRDIKALRAHTGSDRNFQVMVLHRGGVSFPALLSCALGYWAAGQLINRLLEFLL